jgi:hypothetical protein
VARLRLSFSNRAGRSAPSSIARMSGPKTFASSGRRSSLATCSISTLFTTAVATAWSVAQGGGRSEPRVYGCAVGSVVCGDAAPCGHHLRELQVPRWRGAAAATSASESQQ